MSVLDPGSAQLNVHPRPAQGDGTEKCDHNGGLVQLLLNDFNPLAASRQILCITGKKCRYGARVKRILNAATNDCTERRFLVALRDEDSKWSGRHWGGILPQRGGNDGELILTPRGAGIIKSLSVAVSRPPAAASAAHTPSPKDSASSRFQRWRCVLPSGMRFRGHFRPRFLGWRAAQGLKHTPGRPAPWPPLIACARSMRRAAANQGAQCVEEMDGLRARALLVTSQESGTAV